MVHQRRRPRNVVNPDIGFRPDFDLPQPRDLGIDFQLMPAKDHKDSGVRNSSLVALCLAWFVGSWLSYSRNRNVYAAWRRYYGPEFGYVRVMRIVDALEEAGLIIHEKMKPHPNGEFQSRMRFAQGVRATIGSSLHKFVSATPP